MRSRAPRVPGVERSARLLTAAPGEWVVKGGYANQLRRPDAARFTEDLDLRVDATIEAAPVLSPPPLRSIAPVAMPDRPLYA